MDDSKFLITGANGQLGKALQAQYPNAQAKDSDELDITNREAVENFDWSNVTTILNAAAYTNVDGAETAEGRVAAWKANAQAVSYLANIARQHDMTLVHVSTDYVFDGAKQSYSEDDSLSPLGVYGATKAAGDIAAATTPKHLIMRSSWVIGDGKNFVRTMLELGQKDVSPTVVADQTGRPTFTSELVKAIDQLLNNQAAFGTYNVTNGGEPVNWANFARAVFKEANLSNQVTDTSTEQYFKDKPTAAPRPLNSVLDLSKVQAGGFEPTDWRIDLAEYVKKELTT